MDRRPYLLKRPILSATLPMHSHWRVSRVEIVWNKSENSACTVTRTERMYTRGIELLFRAFKEWFLFSHTDWDGVFYPNTCFCRITRTVPEIRSYQSKFINSDSLIQLVEIRKDSSRIKFPGQRRPTMLRHGVLYVWITVLNIEYIHIQTLLYIIHVCIDLIVEREEEVQENKASK